MDYNSRTSYRNPSSVDVEPAHLSSGILVQVESLRKFANELDQQINSLVERLQPLLNKSEISSTGPTPNIVREATCLLSDDLDSLQCQLQSSFEVVMETHRRLSL